MGDLVRADGPGLALGRRPILLGVLVGHMMADDAAANRTQNAVMGQMAATPPTMAPLMQPLACAGTDAASKDKASDAVAG